MVGVYKFIDSSVYTGKDNQQRTTIYLHDVENHRVESFTVSFPLPPLAKDDVVFCDLQLVRTRDNAFLICNAVSKQEPGKKGGVS